MTDPKLKGKKCFVLKRCSKATQADTSLHNQDKALASLIEENGALIVDEIELPGVTGSVPGARDDIDRIIAAKRAGLDFDDLLLPTTDRFPRAGSLHGNNMIWDLEGAGIVVYFAAERLWSDDRMHRVILGFMFDAAQQTGVAISRGATIGVTNSYLEGRSPHTRRPPYGLDRLYSADGKDLHVIRNLADGTQQMLDPISGEVLRVFGRNPSKGTPNHTLSKRTRKFG